MNRNTALAAGSVAALGGYVLMRRRGSASPGGSGATDSGGSTSDGSGSGSGETVPAPEETDSGGSTSDGADSGETVPAYKNITQSELEQRRALSGHQEIPEILRSGKVQSSGAGAAVMVWAKSTASYMMDREAPDAFKNPLDHIGWEVVIHSKSGKTVAVDMNNVEDNGNEYRIARVMYPFLDVGEEIELVEIVPPLP